MTWIHHYTALQKQEYTDAAFRLLPIRFEDRLEIMKWRNEQIYHLRQEKELSIEDQDRYFNEVVAKLFTETKPNQLLFSLLENEVCVGYGGLVHINWDDELAEISFVMNTELEAMSFTRLWQSYLSLIEELAFEELKLNRIFTHAYDMRPHLYPALEQIGYKKEAVLRDHYQFDEKFFDLVIHAKLASERIQLIEAQESDAKQIFEWANDPSVRANSFNPKPINWEEHCKWFQSKLDSKDSRIYLAKQNDQAIGQVRLELKNGSWEIDCSVAKEHRGKGLGKQLIQYASLKLVPGDKLSAKVKADNLPSCMIFEKLGFSLSSGANEAVSCYTKEIV